MPLMAKADLRSPRPPPRAARPVVVPLREKGKITGIGVHAGLWTSAALTAPIEDVPVLRRAARGARAGVRLRAERP